MRSAKGQVATEFFIYSAIFLVAVLAAYFTIFFIQSSEVSAKESLYVKWFGESFASHTNTAMSGQKGFNYTIKFDKLILGKPYSIQFKPAAASDRRAFIFINWSGSSEVFTYPIGNMSLKVSGNCIKTYSPASGLYYEINTSLGELNYYNNGGELVLSQRGC